MGAGQGSLSYMTGEGETVLCDGALMTIIEGEQVTFCLCLQRRERRLSTHYFVPVLLTRT